MTSRQTWFVAIGMAFAFVVGYGGGLFSSASRARAHAAQTNPFHALQLRIGKPLPDGRLLAAGQKPVPDRSWRKGKVVLVFLTTGCDACLAEGRFLRGVVDRRKDVAFLGVLSLEQDERALSKAQKLFPFPVVRDESMSLMRALDVTGVPFKIYLEDGVVRKTWGGAAMTEKERSDFTRWLAEA
jgi:peroxiredoxin